MNYITFSLKFSSSLCSSCHEYDSTCHRLVRCRWLSMTVAVAHHSCLRLASLFYTFHTESLRLWRHSQQCTNNVDRYPEAGRTGVSITFPRMDPFTPRCEETLCAGGGREVLIPKHLLKDIIQPPFKAAVSGGWGCDARLRSFWVLCVWKQWGFCCVLNESPVQILRKPVVFHYLYWWCFQPGGGLKGLMIASLFCRGWCVGQTAVIALCLQFTLPFTHYGFGYFHKYEL